VVSQAKSLAPGFNAASGFGRPNPVKGDNVDPDPVIRLVTSCTRTGPVIQKFPDEVRDVIYRQAL
jgi:hypothetical protein